MRSSSTRSVVTSHGRVPNVLAPFMSDTGTLVILGPDGLWYYVAKNQWTPTAGMTNKEFIITFHKAPPTTLQREEWGIVSGLVDHHGSCDQNWCHKNLSASLSAFVDMKSEGLIMDRTTNPLKSAQYLRARQNYSKRVVSNPIPRRRSNVGV